MSENHGRAEERAILILYATETGNSLDAAERIAREARRWHFHTRLASTDTYPLEDLISEPLVIFVLSTTGSGSEPRPMIKLWQLLLRADLPSDLFDETRFTVFGLGDSAYERFCWASKKVIRRMESLGANEFHPSCHADEQERFGYDGVLGPWLAGLIQTLNTRHPLPSDLEVLPPNQLPPPRVSIHVVPASDTPPEEILPHEPETEYHEAFLKENRRITSQDWYQDVRHLEFGFDHAIQYAPGDVAILHPNAQENDIHGLLERFDWLGCADEGLKMTSLSLDQPVPEYVTRRTVTLRSLFRNTLDFSAVPRKSFFELLRHFTDDPMEKEKFEEFCSPEGQDEMYEYVQRPRRTILEVLLDFRHTTVPKEYIFDLLPLMRPREFSIASSIKKHPRSIQLCAAIVKYKTKLKTARRGLCTAWLAGLDPSPAPADRKTYRVGIHRGLLSLPPTPATPVVCIGPGTGIAPMRSIIQERIVNGAQNNTLYFGCRSAAKDYYYADEWERDAQGGVLVFRVAFSRDQDKKVYVQDLIEEDSTRIWELVGLQAAWVYISGSSNKMPLGVKGAIKNAAIKAGRMTEEDASKWIAKLEWEGRLVEECWS